VNGYVRTSPQCANTGEFAHSPHGGIIDIFPRTSGEPYRLDFFGDTLETLRTFDTEVPALHGRCSLCRVRAGFSEILLMTRSSAGFREHYLARFGPPSGDPVRIGRASISAAGRPKHGLPLFQTTSNLCFDYIWVTDRLSRYRFRHLAAEAHIRSAWRGSDYYSARLDGRLAVDPKNSPCASPSDLFLEVQTNSITYSPPTQLSA